MELLHLRQIPTNPLVTIGSHYIMPSAFRHPPYATGKSTILKAPRPCWSKCFLVPDAIWYAELSVLTLQHLNNEQTGKSNWLRYDSAQELTTVEVHSAMMLRGRQTYPIHGRTCFISLAFHRPAFLSKPFCYHWKVSLDSSALAVSGDLSISPEDSIYLPCQKIDISEN